MKTCVEWLKEVSDEINSLPDNTNDYDILIQLASAIRRKKLQKIMDKCRERFSAADVEPTKENLQIFRNFLEYCWIENKPEEIEEVQNDEKVRKTEETDMIYMHNPDLWINRVCLILAKHLAPIFNLHIYQLLMPTVVFSDYDLELSEFILRDDGVTQLKIVQGFDCLAVETESYKQRESAIRNSQNLLSPAESLRIIYHSKEAPAYYKAIYGTKDENQEAKFIEELKSNDFKVTASYKEEGEIRLLNSILQNIKTRDQFAYFLAEYLCKEGWQKFLDKLFKLSPEILFRLMLDMDTQKLKIVFNNDVLALNKALPNIAEPALYTVLKNGVINKDDPLYVRAMMLCFLRLYKVVRNEGAEFQTFFGSWTSLKALGSWSSFPKKDKLEACNVLINLILSDEPLENIRNTDLFKQHESVLMSGKLYYITMMLPATMENKLEKSPAQEKLPVLGMK